MIADAVPTRRAFAEERAITRYLGAAHAEQLVA